RKSGMSQDGPVTQSATSPFHFSLEPSHNSSCRNLCSALVQEGLGFHFAIAQICRFQIGFYSRAGKFRAEIGIFHDVPARLPKNRTTGVESGTDGQSFISGCGLYPSVAERSFAEDFPIGNTIQSTTAGYDEFIHGHAFM